MTISTEDEEQARELIAEIEPAPEGRGLARPLFYLKSLQIENFRSIEDATFHFQPGLNVIIGANNAAKTAVIDALRIVFALGTHEKKEDLIRLRATDVFSGSSKTPDVVTIKFTATFYGKAKSDIPGQFYELICPDGQIQLGDDAEEYAAFKLCYQAEFRYSASKARYEYVRNDLRGGAALSNPVAYDVLDSMRAIYLAPLRDLVNDRARVGAEIERLILSHTAKGKEEERLSIPDKLKARAIELITGVTDDNRHHAAAGRNLALYAKPYQIGDDSLSFVPDGISADLFSRMSPVFAHSLHGTGKLPLSSNGLGINQLIYAAIVLSRRGDTKIDDQVRKFFLIEEPEAHLHPQLQDSFFHALNQITDHQLFVTSHSPTITAKADLDKIIVMRRDGTGRTAHPLHLADAFDGQDVDKRYLHKFLDVTRSQLLFAKGAIFVEGITEAMLLQVFSEIIGYSLRDAGIEVIVIDAADGYEHFRPLFENGDNTYCRAVFITDGDEDPRGVATDEQLKSSTATLDGGLQGSGNCRIATGYGTFEFGLLRASIIGGGNSAMYQLLANALKAAVSKAVTNSDQQSVFVQDFLDRGRPSLAYQKMKEKRKGLYVPDDAWHGSWRTNTYFRRVKSDFAFCLNEALVKLPMSQAKAQFVVPQYIREGIEFVIGQSGGEA